MPKPQMHNWHNNHPAAYASDPKRSRGRLYPEPEDAARSPFQRDRDRIIHCAAFRRLEYKTQVFVNHEGDHYRTRLTHSLEVSQLARSIARALGLNEDLAEALALAHDLGHTPFGHAGEEALADCMKDFGGFDHNAQTLRILTRLEQRYAEFDGLNLTWETLEGIAKHNGPVPSPPRAMAEYVKQHDLELATYAGGEAQIASLADDIAYNNHDIDDGLRGKLFTLDDLRAIPLVDSTLEDVRRQYGEVASPRLIHEAIRRMINRMVVDLITTTQANIDKAGVKTADDIRRLGAPVAGFSEEILVSIHRLKAFLTAHMYRHYRVNRMTSKARRVVRALFDFFLAEPDCLPTEWQPATGNPGARETAVAVCDFIAGMTDRFAIEEYERIFNPRKRT